MAPEERLAWLEGILGPLDVVDVGGYSVGLATVVPAAMSVGFSDVDSGLVAGDVDVRCEIICAAAGAGAGVQQRGMAVVGTWNTLVGQRIPAQPGTLLPGLVDDPALTVHHGYLREPRIFDRGTPMVTEPDRMTLLLELVLLTDEEYGIAAEQGLEVLERRLRRRRMDLGDWGRD